MTSAHSDLQEFLDWRQCECLNQHNEHSLKPMLKGESGKILQSDCDEELLIHVTFMQAVKISALKIEGPKDQAPNKVRLFVNPPSPLDFDSAKDEKATQELELKSADATAELRFVLFQNVSTLSIFVPGNLGDEEETVISRLVFIGAPIAQEGTKRSKEETDASRKGDWLGSGIAGS